jgi:rhodanese-related sulfurtransferase
MDKKVFRDIISIVVISIVFALIYNWVNPKGVSYIYEPKVAPALPDSALFGSESADKLGEDPADSAPQAVDTSASDQAQEPDESLTAKNEVKPAEEPADYLQATVTYEQMKRIVNDQRFYIIDARAPDMYEKGHIKGAHNIFPYLEQEPEYMRLIFTVPRDRRIIIYCDGGNCDLSHKVAEDLKAAGYQSIFLYSGGWNEWSVKEKN